MIEYLKKFRTEPPRWFMEYQPGDYDSFYYLARTMSLQLLDILLESKQARKLILEDNWYHTALMELHENVNKAKANWLK